MLAGLAVLLVGTVVLTLIPGQDFAKMDSRVSSYASAEELGRNWPRFRGPGGLGISVHSNIPSRFNTSDGGAVLWKTQIPLPGYNSPIVWEDRVFLSGAQQDRREVYCFDANSGQLLWTGDVASSGASSGQIEPMEDTGFAASTMATDGRRVFAIFATGDIAAFGFDGEELWAKNLGTLDSLYGYATSLVVYRNLVLIQYDQGAVEDGKSRLIALDGFSGRTVWEIKRPVSGSWTSPIVAQTPEGAQLITCATPLVIAYDPQSGRELWRANCPGADTAPSPIFAGGLIFAVNPNVELMAIKVDGSGDISKTHIAWRGEDGIGDICSPVSDGEFVFLLTSDYAKLTCYRLSDDSKLWQQEFKKSFNASPSLVNGLLYLLATDGTLIVAQAGSEYKEVGRFELGDTCRGSAAFADGLIFIRGDQNLYCIGSAQVE
jgi:outer membrane protein assembly factor BamB